MARESGDITPSPTRAALNWKPASTPGTRSSGACASCWRPPMPDGIQTYVEDVVCYADLAAPDERTVRAELAEHLQTLATLSHLSDPKEIYAMLKDQFGNPKTVGRAIASAKGRLRTYFKKLRRKLDRKSVV